MNDFTVGVLVSYLGLGVFIFTILFVPTIAIAIIRWWLEQRRIDAEIAREQRDNYHYPFDGAIIMDSTIEEEESTGLHYYPFDDRCVISAVTEEQHQEDNWLMRNDNEDLFYTWPGVDTREYLN